MARDGLFCRQNTADALTMEKEYVNRQIIQVFPYFFNARCVQDFWRLNIGYSIGG
jgi:hypothetical protein